MPTLQIAGAEPTGADAMAGGTLVTHSRHYHAALLRTLYEAEGVDGGAILRHAARQGAGAMHLAGSGDAGARLATLLHRSGLGELEELALGPDGHGQVRLRGSHFALAWNDRYAPASIPVCAASAGILASVLSQHFGSSLRVEEVACVARGDDACCFSVAAGEEAAAGERSLRHEVDGQAPTCRHDGVDRVLFEDLFGASAAAGGQGVIEGPGGPFTRLPAGLYAALVHGFEREVPRLRGPKFGNLPGILLQEAAHRNGFNLFGEILQSRPWLDAVEPRLATAEERLRALLRLVEGFGWGDWEVASFVAGERLIVQIPDSYEGAVHASLFGPSGSPRCYVARGAAAAIMNLLFRGDALAGRRPTDSDYNRIFRSPSSFRALETRCLGMGDAVCEIVVNPLSI